jgi:hypothetical protein
LFVRIRLIGRVFIGGLRGSLIRLFCCHVILCVLRVRAVWGCGWGWGGWEVIMVFLVFIRAFLVSIMVFLVFIMAFLVLFIAFSNDHYQ